MSHERVEWTGPPRHRASAAHKATSTKERADGAKEEESAPVAPTPTVQQVVHVGVVNGHCK